MPILLILSVCEKPDCAFPMVNFQHNTVCEEIDISDNYVDQEGAAALAHMMKENMFVVSLVSGLEIW